MEFAGLEIAGDAAAAGAVVGEKDVEEEMLVEEIDVVFDALLVEGLDDHVTRAVGGVAGSSNRTLAEVPCVTAESSLVDLSFRCAIER
jgi:hypothetical protein